MRRAVLVLVVLLLAGCSGESDGSDATDASTATTASETTTPPTTSEPPVEVTDTFYLLKVPDVSLLPPTADEPETTPYSFGSGFSTTLPRWEYRSQADAAPVEVEATIWIRVVEPLFAPPSQAPCVWSLEIYAGDEYAFPVMCSGPNGPSITAGDYELTFSTGSPNQTAVPIGTTWAFQLRRTAFSPTPNESVLILVNSKEFPSSITIAGVAEPKPSAS